MLKSFVFPHGVFHKVHCLRRQLKRTTDASDVRSYHSSSIPAEIINIINIINRSNSSKDVKY